MCSLRRISVPSVHKNKCCPRPRIARVSDAISGYSSGSPPQIETIGVRHSSIAAKHSSTVSMGFSTRDPHPLFPTPLQPQPPRGSSESMTGNLRSPRSLFPAMCFKESKTSPMGYRIVCLGNAPFAPRIQSTSQAEITWIEFRCAILHLAPGLISITCQRVYGKRIFV